jgi:hypothetical protein
MGKIYSKYTKTYTIIKIIKIINQSKEFFHCTDYNTIQWKKLWKKLWKNI